MMLVYMRSEMRDGAGLPDCQHAAGLPESSDGAKLPLLGLPETNILLDYLRIETRDCCRVI
jgi:hypothetical protein